MAPTIARNVSTHITIGPRRRAALDPATQIPAAGLEPRPPTWACSLAHPQSLRRKPLRPAAIAHGPSRAGGLAGAGRLVGGHELVGARADQVGAAHLSERLAQERPVVGVVIAQERLVQPALPQPLDRLDLVASPVPHAAQR